MKETVLEFCAPQDDNKRLMNLCGPLDDHLRQIEQALDVRIARCGHCIRVRGRGAKTALAALENFYQRAAQPLCLEDIQLALAEARHSPHTLTAPPEHSAATSVLNARRAGLSARTPAQREYLYSILRHDLTFGRGPRLKQASGSAFCQAIWRKKSTPIFARYTMRSTICSVLIKPPDCSSGR